MIQTHYLCFLKIESETPASGLETVISRGEPKKYLEKNAVVEGILQGHFARLIWI